jgi:hypothetical protein
MKKIFFLLAALTSLSTQLFAQQSWQWGKQGGSSVLEDLYDESTEKATSIATDPAGNVYTLSSLFFHKNDVKVDGHPLVGYNLDPNLSRDLVLSSFTCTGTYRWSKVISTNVHDRGIAVKTDSLGGVYVTGFPYVGFIHDKRDLGDITVSTDTLITANYKTIYVVKYDTAGRYQWVRTPQSDTIGAWTLSLQNNTLAMDVDGAGNTYVMCYLSAGTYGTGAQAYQTVKDGVHLLRYNKEGDFLGGIPMDITFLAGSPPLWGWQLARSAAGKFVVTGWGGGVYPHIGSIPMERSAFVASFSASGNLEWVKQNTVGGPAEITFFRSPVLDAAGNIFLTGSSTAGNGFGPYVFTNPNTTDPMSIPIVLKLSAAGDILWMKWGHSERAFLGAGVLTREGTFVTGGTWFQNLSWPGSPISLGPMGQPGSGALFLAHFNSQTGALLQMDTLPHAPDSYTEVQAMATDTRGNIYATGSFAKTLKIGGSTITSNTIGFTDFFVAKYGASNCAPAGIAPVTTSAGGSGLALAPNPASTNVQVGYSFIGNGGSLELYDLAGRQLYRKNLTQKAGTEKILLPNYLPGLYLVVLREAGVVVAHQRLSVGP